MMDFVPVELDTPLSFPSFKFSKKSSVKVNIVDVGLDVLFEEAKVGDFVHYFVLHCHGSPANRFASQSK